VIPRCLSFVNITRQIRGGFVNKTRQIRGGYVNKTMRPLKYNHLGEMRIIRVTHRASKLIIPMQNLMQKLEESGRDSVGELISVFEHMSEEL